MNFRGIYYAAVMFALMPTAALAAGPVASGFASGTLAANDVRIDRC